MYHIWSYLLQASLVMTRVLGLVHAASHGAILIGWHYKRVPCIMQWDIARGGCKSARDDGTMMKKVHFVPWKLQHFKVSAQKKL